MKLNSFYSSWAFYGDVSSVPSETIWISPRQVADCGIAWARYEFQSQIRQRQYNSKTLLIDLVAMGDSFNGLSFRVYASESARVEYLCGTQRVISLSLGSAEIFGVALTDGNSGWTYFFVPAPANDASDSTYERFLSTLSNASAPTSVKVRVSDSKLKDLVVTLDPLIKLLHREEWPPAVKELLVGDLEELSDQDTLELQDVARAISRVEGHLGYDKIRCLLNPLKRKATLVLGPPGSGKTALLAKMIAPLMRLTNNDRVLIVAPSNQACYEICQKLDQRNLFWCKNKNEFKSGYYGDSFIWRASPDGIKKVGSDCLKFVQRNRDAQIVVATISMATSIFEKFSALIIDEASLVGAAQGLAFAALQPDIDHLVVVGDDKQNSPVVLTDKLKITGWADSLFTISGLKPILLTTTFRCPKGVVDVLSPMLYDRLWQSSWNEDFLITDLARNAFGENAVHDGLVGVVQTRSRSFKTRSDSWENDDEVDAAVEIVQRLFPGSSGVGRMQEGERKVRSCLICAPYAAQIERLERRFKQEIPQLTGKLSFMTSTACQGREFDAGIFLFTRTLNPKKPHISLGFASEPGKINVGLTRSKQLQIFVIERDLFEKSTDEVISEFRRCVIEAGIVTTTLNQQQQSPEVKEGKKKRARVEGDSPTTKPLAATRLKVEEHEDAANDLYQDEDALNQFQAHFKEMLQGTASFEAVASLLLELREGVSRRALSWMEEFSCKIEAAALKRRWLLVVNHVGLLTRDPDISVRQLANRWVAIHHHVFGELMVAWASNWRAAVDALPLQEQALEYAKLGSMMKSICNGQMLLQNHVAEINRGMAGPRRE